MEEMGFVDRKLNFEALKASKGSVEGALSIVAKTNVWFYFNSFNLFN